MSQFIQWFDKVGLDDVGKVGGKNASLGEMINRLGEAGIKVPTGFCVTADAYSYLLEQGELREKLSNILKDVDKNDLDQLGNKARSARALIKQAGLPAALAKEIRYAYLMLSQQFGDEPDVAVRSSATAEDLPEASFAGQQESFLNVRGEVALLEACLNCFASLFTERAIAYRIDQGFSHMDVRLSIAVQKMVRSDLASSGVIFTLDTESGFDQVVMVTSAYGLGENIVGGQVDPDEFIVFKPTLESGFSPIIRRRIGAKQMRLIYCGHGSKTTKNVEVNCQERERASITDSEILQLAQWACIIESYYSKRLGRKTAMDIEWAKDGLDGQLYILQARPETVHSFKEKNKIESYQLEKKGGVIIVSGRAVGEKIGAGKCRVIKDASQLAEFQDGEVLVAEMTDPDWEPVMKRAAGIITNRGGRTCHAAIVSRELGVPCIVGTDHATKAIYDGQPVTVCCAEGEVGKVYAGELAFEKFQTDLRELPQTRTDIMLNLGNPDQAFFLAGLPVAGVGLAREEFVIANQVRVHPLALTRFDELKDKSERAAIEKLTRGYLNKSDYFVEKLSEGIATIAAAFYPRPVIVRLSDFKSNEYAGLLGGRQFEVREDNPMIGFRGASRYFDERYRDGFALECKAMARIRNEMGLKNVILMVPFCRTIYEARSVLSELTKNGLPQGVDGLEIYMMCELPSNVFLMSEFAELFDGFSIGSNDLTQLVLGVDRDSEILANSFDERNDAVKIAIDLAVSRAKAKGRKIGICGQAPSDYEDFARFLVEIGIDSMSLNEDSVVKTIYAVAETESSVGAARKYSTEAHSTVL